MSAAEYDRLVARVAALIGTTPAVVRQGVARDAAERKIRPATRLREILYKLKHWTPRRVANEAVASGRMGPQYRDAAIAILRLNRHVYKEAYRDLKYPQKKEG